MKIDHNLCEAELKKITLSDPHEAAREVATRLAQGKYKQPWFFYSKSKVGIGFFVLVITYFAILPYGYIPQITWLSVTAVALSLLAHVGDIFTTYLFYQLFPEFKKRGIAFPSQEANPFLPDYPTGKDLLSSWPIIVGFIVTTMIFYFAPYLGFAVAITQALEALHNWYGYCEAKYQIKVYDEFWQLACL